MQLTDMMLEYASRGNSRTGPWATETPVGVNATTGFIVEQRSREMAMSVKEMDSK